MQTYHFTFTLADDPRDLVVWSNALYEAGGDDSSPGICSGRLYASFDRDAATLEEAIRSAAEVVRQAGLQILRCEIDAEELAELLQPVG